MTVYVEVVLLNNFAVDFALCISAQILRNKKLNISRALIASIIGALVACYYAIAPKWLQIVIKILLAPLMSLIALKIDGKCIKRKLACFLKSTIAFCLLTYFLGGIVYGLSYVLGVDISSYILLFVVAIGVAISIIAVYLLVRKKSKGEKSLKQVELVIGGNSHLLSGLCDSGNLLVDSISGLPVVILSNDASLKLGDIKSEGSICVQTVAGDEHMSLFRPDCIKVGECEKQALCAISAMNFEEYDIILQNSLF